MESVTIAATIDVSLVGSTLQSEDSQLTNEQTSLDEQSTTTNTNDVQMIGGALVEIKGEYTFILIRAFRHQNYFPRRKCWYILSFFGKDAVHIYSSIRKNVPLFSQKGKNALLIPNQELILIKNHSKFKYE